MNAQNWLRLAMAVSILLLAGFLGLASWHTHEVLYREADQQIKAQAKQLAANLSEILHASDLIGQLLDQKLSSLSWEEITRSEAIHRELLRLVQEIPGSSITLIRPDGLIANSTRNWSATRLSNTQPYVIAAGPNGRYVTPAYIGTISHQEKFSFVYRCTSKDGTPNGAIVISTPVADLAATFGSMHHVQSLVIRDDNGEIVASIPEGKLGIINPNIFTDTSNEIRRIQAPEPVRSSTVSIQNFHLLVSSMMADSVLTRHWLREMVGPTLIIGVSGMLIVGVLRIAIRAIDREEAARQELRLAEQVMRQNHHMDALGRLTAGVAHDFNNIMAIIIGNLDLLREKTNVRYINAIASAVSRGERLVKHLLSFTRRQMILPDFFDVNVVLRDLEPIIKTSLGGLVKLNFQLSNGPLTCQFDGHEFELAIINICNNARQSMPEGGQFRVTTAQITLGIHSKMDLLPGDYAHINLIDTGEGMPPNVIEHAFEPFFTTRVLHDGTGLGLSQVYGFCKQAHGMATIQSKVGNGTDVGMYLPIVLVSLRSSVGGSMSKTVLVVEDNTELLEIIEEVLIEIGWTVLTATDGTQGLCSLKERGSQITLLLTDVVMPDISGTELASRAKDTYPQIKVLLMTGYAEVQTGMLPLLRKPFRRQQLIEAVSRVMSETGIGRWSGLC